MAGEKELTDKQKAFCIEYVKDWNGAQAAIRAGYSKKTAKEQASRLLTNVNLLDYIEKIQKDIQKLANISYLSQIQDFQKYIANDETSNTEKLRAMQELNKMLGFYAPEQSQVSIKTEQPLFGDGDE